MNKRNSAVEVQFPLHAVKPRAQKDAANEPPSGNGRLPRITQVMALAIQFQDMILGGDVRDYADLARLGCITRERMSQIMKLIWLAPDIQQEIMEFPPTSGGARFPISEVAVRRIASNLLWAAQRSKWAHLKENVRFI